MAVKLKDWPRRPLVVEPRRPYLENLRARATNRVPDGVTVKLFDQDAPEREEGEQQ